MEMGQKLPNLEFRFLSGVSSKEYTAIVNFLKKIEPAECIMSKERLDGVVKNAKILLVSDPLLPMNEQILVIVVLAVALNFQHNFGVITQCSVLPSLSVEDKKVLGTRIFELLVKEASVAGLSFIEAHLHVLSGGMMQIALNSGLRHVSEGRAIIRLT